MVSHSLWWHATMLEVYTLNAALISIILYLVASYQRSNNKNYIYGASFFWGIGCLNHVLMGLFGAGFLACLVVLIKRRAISFSTIALSAIFFLMGFQIYLFLFLKEFNLALAGKGEVSWATLWEVLKSQLDYATGGHFKKAMFPQDLPADVMLNWRLNYLFLLLMNFPSVIFPLGFFGIWRLALNRESRIFFIFLISSLVAQITWSANYIIWDMYAFGMPVWLMFGFLGIYGLAEIWQRATKVSRIIKILLPTILIGPILYATVPNLAKRPGFWRDYFLNFVDVHNYWDTAEYFADPNKRDYDLVERLANSLFEKLPVGAYLIDSDGKGHYPFGLYYHDVLGRRPDITFISLFSPTMDTAQGKVIAARIDALLKNGAPVYVSSLSYPERIVLSHLYDMWDGPAHDSYEFACNLDNKNLLRGFQTYSLERIELLPDTGAHIYKIVKRAQEVKVAEVDPIFEGERLGFLSSPGPGRCIAQSLGVEWSGGGHILCIDNKIGDEIILNFEMPSDFAGDVGLRFTKSYDFTGIKVSIIGSSDALEMDLYSPSIALTDEFVLSDVKLKKGPVGIKVIIKTPNRESEARNGFGIDYVRLIRK
jgi:hypothetical protein